MINLTVEEKATRYDALQSAIKHTIKTYKRRRTEAMKNYQAYGALNIGAYNFGTAETYGVVTEMLERWADQ